MSLNIKEAAKLVRKSTRTIKAWRAEGIDVTNPDELVQYSEIKDIRARGSSANLVRHRRDRTTRKPDVGSGIRSYFPAGLSAEEFVELPLPCRPEIGERALDALASICDAFARRIDELKAIRHQHSIDLAEKDLANVGEALRLLEITLEGFEA